jgi:hypothetical protein
MKKIIYLFAFLSVCNLTKAQVLFSFAGSGQESKVKKHLEKVSSDYDNIAAGYKFNSCKIQDTLVLSVNGPVQIIRKMTFNGQKKKCDFDQVILPNCDQCSKKQIDVILNDKKMRWKEISKNQYLSGIDKKTLLTISYDKNNACSIMTFTALNIDKLAYLNLYKDLGEYVTAENTAH